MLAGLLSPNLENVLFTADYKVILPVINHPINLVSQESLSILLSLLKLLCFISSLFFELGDFNFAKVNLLLLDSFVF